MIYIFNLFLILFVNFSSQAAPPVILLCPTGAYTPGMPPKVIYKINKTKTIAVCGAEEANKSDKKKKLLSEFAVYSVDEKGKFSTALREFSSQDNFFLRPTKKGLVFEHVILLKNKWVPAFASTLNCSREFCTFSDNKCVFKAKGKPDRSAIKEFRSYFEGSKKGQSPSEELVYRLVNAALLGDKDAQSLLLAEQPKDLILEEPAATEFADGKIVMRHLKIGHCL